MSEPMTDLKMLEQWFVYRRGVNFMTERLEAMERICNEVCCLREENKHARELLLDAEQALRDARNYPITLKRIRALLDKEKP